MAVRIPPRLRSPVLLATVGRAESTAALSSSGGGAKGHSMSPPSYTTLKDRASCDREIKKSKFIAVASPIPDERSAHSFLAEANLLGRTGYPLDIKIQVIRSQEVKLDNFTENNLIAPRDKLFIEVRDPRATHNCWAYKLGDQYRCNDDGEPSGTAGKPIYSAIVSSGIDMVMVVVIRYFGGIKLGTGGLVRAYGGVASECLKGATTCFVKPKAPIGIEVPFELLGAVYHQIQSFQVEDIKQDYDTGKDGFTMVTFRVDYEKVEDLENAVNSTCSRKLEFYKH